MRIQAIFQVSKFSFSQNTYDFLRLVYVGMQLCMPTHICMLQITNKIQMRVCLYLSIAWFQKSHLFIGLLKSNESATVQIITASLIYCFLFQRKSNNQINLWKKKKKAFPFITTLYVQYCHDLGKNGHQLKSGI